jgi:hypothetical protein
MCPGRELTAGTQKPKAFDPQRFAPLAATRFGLTLSTRLPPADHTNAMVTTRHVGYRLCDGTSDAMCGA